LRTAPAQPFCLGIGPIPEGATAEQLRITRLGEQFQWPEAQQRHPVPAHVALTIGHHVDSDGVGVLLESGFFLWRTYSPAATSVRRIASGRRKGQWRRMAWLFNMQQSRPNPLGFASNNYGVAFVLAGSLVN